VENGSAITAILKVITQTSQVFHGPSDTGWEMGVNGDEDGGLFQEGRLKNIAKGFMCTCEWL